MANYPAPFRTDNALGGQFGAVNVYPDVQNGYDTPHMGVGQEFRGTDGTRGIFVKFIGAVNQGDTVIIDRNGNCQQITTALAAAGIGRVGSCQVPGGAPAPSVLADGRTAYGYGWVMLEGDDLGVNVASGTAAGSALATTGTPGVATNVANASGAVAITSCTASDFRLVN